MTEKHSRRRILRLTGGSALTVSLAGCSAADDDDAGGDTGGDGENATEDDNESDTPQDNEEGETNESGDRGEAGTETDGEENATEEGAGESSGVDPSEWEDVETIRMLGNASSWIGVEPEMIAEEENPTIVLFEGNQYEFVWENDDGAGHNIELHDSEGELVEDYGTEIVRGTGEEQTLEFEATADIAEYVCVPHITTMVGDVQVDQ
ncbi:cupredoxin domain-containing protein (plasmid) [Haloferacaceae archaeon DSL9]